MSDDEQPPGRKFWSRRKLVAAGAAVALLAAAGLGYGVGRLQSTDPGDAAGKDPAGVSPDASKSAAPSASASADGSEAGPPAGFPDAGNTGVPPGTNLSDYSGPCTITGDGTVVDSKTVNCSTLEVRAKNVVIRKSKINGIVVTTEREVFSFTLEDSEVNAGTVQRAAVGSTNITIIRSNIHGGQTTVTCAANCTIRDSYLHGQELPPGSDWHLGGFLANDIGADGRTNATLIHNTIVCDNPGTSAGGGCSGDVNLFADFGPVSSVTVQDNLFGANDGISYCVYGGSTSGKAHTSGVRDIVFAGNVFRRGNNQKCGYYGPITSFDPSRPGNRWENNRWDDGTLLQSEH